MLVAIAAVVVGVGGLGYALTIPTGVAQRVGPQLVPAVAFGTFAILGAVLLWQAETRRSSSPSVAPDPAPVEWRRVMFIVLGLAANLLLIGRIGFAPASIVLFVAVSQAAGSRSWVRDITAGIILVLSIELVFVHVLGLRLGHAPLDLLFKFG